VDLRDGDRVRLQALVDGTTFNGTGHGVVEALMEALQRVHGIRAVMESFDEYALAAVTEASAMACVRIRTGEEVSGGVALAEDTTIATLQAVLTAVGRQVGARVAAA
jgi:2-isopropylmalate synthase